MKDLDKNIKRKYSLSDYDLKWVVQFGSIKNFLSGIFGDKALKIEHVGSTSVQGMKAKPLIDILIVVEKMESFEKEKQSMIEAGYQWGENYIAPNTLLFFKLGSDGEKLENIHVCEKGAPKEKQFIVMRDFLRTHPDKVKEYSDLKQRNTELYPNDYPAYRTAKAPFLQELEQQAYEWNKGKGKDWSEYYEITKANPPSKLLVKALEHVTNKNKALDIGGGALKDTRYLLDQGFDVTVIDKSPLMEQEANALANNKLHAFTTSFEDFDFPENEFDIASAMFALPFTGPADFVSVFTKIKDSLKTEGVFCGQFFGVNDEWSKNPKMTFHNEAQAKDLLDGLEIISFKEIEEDSTTANGTPKHWHIFHIIAKK
jgi:tellurite methyltransferase